MLRHILHGLAVVLIISALIGIDRSNNPKLHRAAFWLFSFFLVNNVLYLLLVNQDFNTRLLTTWLAVWNVLQMRTEWRRSKA